MRVILGSFLLFASSVQAVTNYYIDPDWTGTKSGTQSEPWSELSASEWSTINTSLGSDDVTVFFSAREAGSDVDEDFGAGVDITDKTADPGFTLTLDGYSKYNSNDSTPSWSDYTGTSKCEVDFFNAQNLAHTKYNDVVIQGFRIVRETNGKAVSICGDNWLVDNNDISHGSGVTQGPLVLLVPTADAANEGSGSWCAASDNITISNNVVHDSYGETIYLGSGGSNPDSAGGGCPSHSNVTVSNNEVYNSGTRGGQGDGIDAKACMTDVTISGNEIYNISSSAVRAIVTQGQTDTGANQNYVIEKNYIHDISNLGDAAIALVDSWGTPKDIEIRNNIIDSNVSGRGILVYETQATGVRIYNNTIYNNSDTGIEIYSGVATVKNNALLDNNSGGNQAVLVGAITSTNNAYSDTFSGGCTDCVSGLASNDFENPTAGAFKPSRGSALINQAETISSFSDDYDGTARINTVWDIGAYEILTPGSASRTRIGNRSGTRSGSR